MKFWMVAASGIIGARPAAGSLGKARDRSVDDALNILHRLRFARGSEALDFVRTLRELTETQIHGDIEGIGPVLVYGARIVAPDVPAELYVSVGALTLAHALGIGRATGPSPWTTPGINVGGATTSELPADMALLFTASVQPDERTLP
jgi:hypothetical protein